MYGMADEEYQIPIFLINGQLESGKTRFITETIEMGQFDEAKKKLLIVCEEGEEEYDQKMLDENGIDMVVLEKEEFTTEKLNELDKKYDPWLVIVEYNGMWEPTMIFETEKPKGWQIYQSITLFNAAQFGVQWANMKMILAETVKYADMVIFNRCKTSMELGSYRRSMKALNSYVQIVFEDKNGDMMSIAEQLPYDVNANVILNQLYKHTQLQDTFGVIMLALVGNQPKVMNLLEMLNHYLNHQEEVVTRRTQYELNKAEERAHILKGLLIALDNIDEVINIIRGSQNVQIAKAELIERFGLSEVQAQAIVDMRLRALTGLEREKIEAEYKELMEQISRLKAILADRKLLLGVIKEEILVIRDKYGDERRTSIGFDEFDISMEDLIPREDVVITMTKLGYIKRMSNDTFKAQNRGGKGIKGMQTLDEDYVEELFMTHTHHYIMFFTNTGRVYRLKGYEIPEASRTSRGTAIINLLQLMPGEKISAVIPIEEYREGEYLFMATKKGLVKKTPITDYANVRKTGLAAITLREEDELIEVKYTDNNQDILLVTKYGQCIRFKETDVRSTGRTSMGVRGMNLSDRDEVIGMQLDSQGSELLFVSEKGMGKRTDMDEFTPQNRGGKGVKCYKITEKTGNVVGVKAVNEEDEIMIINTEGIIIRMKCEGISVLGRITSGVKLINLKDKDIVASIAKVRKGDEDDSEEEQESTSESEEADVTENDTSEE